VIPSFVSPIFAAHRGSSIRSLAQLGSELLVGTSRNELVSMQLDDALHMGDPRLVMAGHYDEVWGLVVHPTQANTIVTSCDDGTLRLWDFATNRMLDKVPLPGKEKSRVVDISPDGRWLVVGSVCRNINSPASPLTPVCLLAVVLYLLLIFLCYLVAARKLARCGR